MSAAVLKFNGHEYDLSKIIAQATSGPNIQVKKDEIAFTKHLADFDQTRADDKERPLVVFFKFNNQYYPLLGTTSVHSAVAAGEHVVSGKLITGFALKKARLDKGGTDHDLLERGEQRPFQDALSALKSPPQARLSYPPAESRGDYSITPQQPGQRPRTESASDTQGRVRSPYRKPAPRQ